MSEQDPLTVGGEDGAAPDLAAVLDDDWLVESVASGRPTDTHAGEVAALLVAWRDDLDAAPVPVHPDLGEAQQALAAAVRRARWRLPLRVLSPVAAAAAAAGIAVVGIGYAAHQSVPGDPLWGVSQTIFAEHSRSVQAAADVSSDLKQAEVAIASGAPAAARTALARAATDLAAVDPGAGRQELVRRHSELVARLGDVGSTTPVPAPGPSVPATTVSTSPGPSSGAPVAPATPTVASPPSTTDQAPSASSTVDPSPTSTGPAPSSNPALPSASSVPPTTTGSASTATAPSTTSPPAVSTAASGG